MNAMFKKKNWFTQEVHASEGQNKNPWLGLATYNTDDAERFRGRDKATQEVSSLIDNSLVVTLYGKSGVGKSSLINAGIIPMLSNVGYRVVAVNIREMKASCIDGEDIYHRTIVTLTSVLHVDIDTVDETSLWKVLHNKECFEGISEFPVIIFDQFEEAFLDVAPEESDLFVKAISKLTDTGFSIDDDSFISNNRFRILLSLREDDLFRLEDSIDRNGFSRMKSNRYRLHSFSRCEAESIIELGKDFFDKYDTCKEKILGMSSLSDGGIDAATLSLLCYRLFEKARANASNMIFEEMISKEDDPLYRLYMEEIASLNYREQIFIENSMITSSGRRDIVSLEEFRSKVKNADRLLENSKSHFSLFRKTDHEKHVEFIHDSLAKAIYKNKCIRSEQLERKWKLIKSLSVSTLCLCLSLLPLLFAYYNIIRHNYTTIENDFYGRVWWAWVILLVPLLNCVLVTCERKRGKIVTLAVICLLMALNNGLLRTSAFKCVANLSHLFDFNLTAQVILLVVFVLYSFRLYDDRDRIKKYICILYINLVTFVCVLPGFGYYALKIHNAVGLDEGISVPWAYTVYEKDNKYGYSDCMGNLILPCVFDTVVTDSCTFLSKHVRTLNLKNDGIRVFLNSNQGNPYYKDGILSFYIMPSVENKIKKLAGEKRLKKLACKLKLLVEETEPKKTDENRLKASIFKRSREQIIRGFTNSNSLYDADLAKEIEWLYKIQSDSTCNLLDSLNNPKAIITDETVSQIRTNLCKCICMLHMLESFGKQENITDDDIAHSILALQFFTYFEIFDEHVKGINAEFNTTLCLNLNINGIKYQGVDDTSFTIGKYLQGNKRDVYFAFKNLVFFDLAVHQSDLQEFLEGSAKNTERLLRELSDLCDQIEKYSSDGDNRVDIFQQKAIKILSEDSSVSSKYTKLTKLLTDVKNQSSQFTEHAIKQQDSIMSKPMFLHNDDVFNYKKVISPLIKCIAENDIPDQSTALTDIAYRLMIMGMFRGFEMHDYIEELQNAYQKSTERTMKEAFKSLLTIDSMEVSVRQATDESRRLLNKLKRK